MSSCDWYTIKSKLNDEGTLIKYVICAPADGGSLLFFILLLLLYFGWGQKLSHNLGIIRALSSEAPIGMAGYPNWIRWNRIESNRKQNQSQNRIWNLHSDMRIMFVICQGLAGFYLEAFPKLWNCSVERISRVAIYEIRVMLISMGKCPLYGNGILDIFRALWERPKVGPQRPTCESSIRVLLRQLNVNDRAVESVNPFLRPVECVPLKK